MSSNNYDSLINKEHNNKIEPFDKIEQGPKKYIPNIPSVISDMKKNKLYQEEISNNENLNKNLSENNNQENFESKEEDKMNNKKISEGIDISKNNDKDFTTIICDYWNTFRNNETVSTIINPYQDDGECVNKVYKIYSCITITLILIVIILSITLS